MSAGIQLTSSSRKIIYVLVILHIQRKLVILSGALYACIPDYVIILFTLQDVLLLSSSTYLDLSSCLLCCLLPECIRRIFFLYLKFAAWSFEHPIGSRSTLLPELLLGVRSSFGRIRKNCIMNTSDCGNSHARARACTTSFTVGSRRHC